MEQVGLLHQVGINVVLVHGGGPQSRPSLAEALGVPTEFVAGRRVTNQESLDVATMVLNGQINTRILCGVSRSGHSRRWASAVSMRVSSRAHKRPPVNMEGKRWGKGRLRFRRRHR